MSFELILPYFPEELRALLLDPSISDLMINGTTGVYADRDGVVQSIPLSCPYTNERLQAAIERVARILGQDLTIQNPILNTRLPDGSRVAVVGPPSSINGPTLTIRKFNRWYSSDDLIASGSLPATVRDRVVGFMAEKKNGMISGGTGSGKAAHTDQQHYDRSKLLNLQSSLIYRQRKLAFERRLLEEKQRWVAANPDLAPIDLPGVPEPKAIDIIRAAKHQPEGGCVAHYGPFAITVSKPGRYSRLTTDFGESPEFDAHYPDITSSGSVLGTLTRHWNSIGSTISMDETQIDGMIRTIESLESTLASKMFPHQEQLDTKRARLKELDEHFKTIAAAEGGLGADPDLDTEEAA